jgi:D-sedoheptulose 7-phosphate isomerase
MAAVSAGELLDRRAAGLAQSLEAFRGSERESLQAAADALSGAVAGGDTVFVCGNGGSAAHAAHFEAELVGRFRHDRTPLRSVYLGLSVSTSTAVSNDFGLEQVFARPLAALCGSGDALLAISTSGTSPNVAAAVAVARDAGAVTVLLSGPNAPDGAADVVVRFPSDAPDTIQEGHQLIVHVLVEAIEAAAAPPG